MQKNICRSRNSVAAVFLLTTKTQPMLNLINFLSLEDVCREDSDLLPETITQEEAQHLLSLNTDSIYEPSAVLEGNVLSIHSGLEEDPITGDWGNDLQCGPTTFIVK